MAKHRSTADDPDISRQETVVEKSDAMAREYSASREIRLREERVRRLAVEPEPRRPAAERRERPPRPPVSRREARGDEPSREPARNEPSHEAPRAEASRSDPPARARSAEPLPRADPVAPRHPPQREEAHTPAVDELAMELEELLREFRHGWRNLRQSDRVTLVSSVLVLVGVFMPWVSDPAHSMQIGLLSGGMVHLGIAIASFALVVKGTPGAFGGIGSSSLRERTHRHRRASLWLVLLGAASTFVGAYLLLVFGLQKDASWPVELHFGFYWTLAAGTGLSYGGFSRFGRRRS